VILKGWKGLHFIAAPILQVQLKPEVYLNVCEVTQPGLQVNMVTLHGSHATSDVIMIAFHIRQAALLAEAVVVVIIVVVDVAASMMMILQWENGFVIRGKRSRGAT
jgi:hypothetical protein